jgi:hypothetical protein
MATDISGWVEININDYWFGAVKVNTIIKRNYGMFDLLFGGRSENYEEAIAPRRPLDKVSIDAGEPHYYQTWIGLNELIAIDWTQHQEIFSGDWQRLIQIMKILAEDERVTDVRLIVYFF